MEAAAALLYEQLQHQAAFILDPAVYLSSSPIDQFPLIHHHQTGGLSNASYNNHHSSREAIQEASTSSPDALPQASAENKRKQSIDGSCLCITSQSKASKKNKSSGRKKSKAKDSKETNEEPPSGYIHVRARRGQATDSHSLAERVRRERISERMKKLQDLVPGCDKIIGKALVLDEIINYVQSLQNQVEFLSMKLASENPILYNFDVGFEGYMSQSQEMGSISQPIPAAIQSSHIPHTATSSPQQMLEPQAAFPLQEQGPTTFSQETASFLMQMCDHHKRGFINQVELRDMCSFL